MITTLNEVVYNIFGSFDNNFKMEYNKNGKPVYSVPEYSVQDLSKEIKEYISLDNNKDILNAEMSARALQLHAQLMNVLWGLSWAHEDEGFRRAFATILTALRVWIKDDVNFFVFSCGYRSGWACIPEKQRDKNHLSYLYGEIDFGIDGDTEVNNSRYEINSPLAYAVGYFEENPEDICLGRSEYHPGSTAGSTGMYNDPKTTSMTKEGANRIRKMGLVPCILETGSFHENFFYLVGIYPQCWEQWKKHYRDSDSLITRVEE